MVACDQSFDAVDQPEFRSLLEYTHLRPSLHIPHRGAVRTRIMKMGEDTFESVKKMIAVSKIYCFPSHAPSLMFNRSWIVK